MLRGGDVSMHGGTDALGGGIYHISGTLQLFNTTVRDNKAQSGGGIRSSGHLGIV